MASGSPSVNAVCPSAKPLLETRVCKHAPHLFVGCCSRLQIQLQSELHITRIQAPYWFCLQQPNFESLQEPTAHRCGDSTLRWLLPQDRILKPFRNSPELNPRPPKPAAKPILHCNFHVHNAEMYLYLYLCFDAHTSSTYLWVYIHPDTSTHTCTRTHTYLPTNIHTYIHTHVHTYIRYIGAHKRSYIYIYIYIMCICLHFQMYIGQDILQ